VTALERALLEQIAFLTSELERIRAERAAQELAEDKDSPISYALRDPGFRAWLLRRQLQRSEP
jgi:hypothetical protein